MKSEDGRRVLILESTNFHPQGGGQPSDTGFILFRDSQHKFIVHDVRSKDGVVFHYGEFEGVENGESQTYFEKGMKVDLQVDGSRRSLNSRLHSAGHLLDACMSNVGLGHLEPGKGYHFPDGPFVEYKGIVSQSEQQCKREQLELEANALISRGGKDSTPRIVKFGDSPGCPCGGTHVNDISDIKSLKISQIRTKKGLTKVSYNIGA